MPGPFRAGHTHHELIGDRERAGLELDYGCPGGGVLAGEPHRENTPWTIFYATIFHANQLTERQIAQAWW